MSSFLKISGAASLALHAMTYMALRNDGKPVSTKEVAQHFKVSEDHLHKVFQRLTRARLAETVRGPRGGFRIAGDPGKITLLNIYEAIEGPLDANFCLLESMTCNYNKCIFGGVIDSVNTQLRTYLEATSLSDLAGSLTVQQPPPPKRNSICRFYSWLFRRQC